MPIHQTKLMIAKPQPTGLLTSPDAGALEQQVGHRHQQQLEDAEADHEPEEPAEGRPPRDDPGDLVGDRSEVVPWRQVARSGTASFAWSSKLPRVLSHDSHQRWRTSWACRHTCPSASWPARPEPRLARSVGRRGMPLAARVTAVAPAPPPARSPGSGCAPRPDTSCAAACSDPRAGRSCAAPCCSFATAALGSFRSPNVIACVGHALWHAVRLSPSLDHADPRAWP